KGAHTRPHLPKSPVMGARSAAALLHLFLSALEVHLAEAERRIHLFDLRPGDARIEAHERRAAPHSVTLLEEDLADAACDLRPDDDGLIRAQAADSLDLAADRADPDRGRFDDDVARDLFGCRARTLG